MKLSEVSDLSALTADQVARIVYCTPDPGEKAATVALLLGGNPLVLRKRAQDAASLWKKGKVSYVVASGGVEWDTEYGRMSEASLMGRYLAEYGVDAAAILLEEDSRTTVENMLCSALLLSRTLKIFQVPSLYVVTSPCHLRRALFYAESLLPRFIGVRGYCEPLSVDSPEGWTQDEFYANRTLRELDLIKKQVDRKAMADIEF